MCKSMQEYPWLEKDDIWIFGDVGTWETFELLYYDVYIRGYITNSPILAEYNGKPVYSFSEFQNKRYKGIVIGKRSELLNVERKGSDLFKSEVKYVYLENILELLDEKIVDRKKRIVVFWGAGKIASQILPYLKQRLDISFIIDNNKAISGTEILGIKICHPSELLPHEWKKYFFVIGTRYYLPIKEQLGQYGLEEQNDYVPYWWLIPSVSYVASRILDMGRTGEIDQNYLHFEEKADGLHAELLIAKLEFLFKKYYIYKQEIKNGRKKVNFLIETKNYIEALKYIERLGKAEYLTNYQYLDEELENELLQSAYGLNLKATEGVNDRYIIFYDAFALSYRGLALIYMRALLSLGFTVFYVTFQDKEDLDILKKEIQDSHNGSSIMYISSEIENGIMQLYRLIESIPAKYMFLYTTPYDVIGLTVFSLYHKKRVRFQINLTDHAFWLGRFAFDYCIEFRNYGYNISCQKRKIKKEKLLMLPYYPVIRKEKYQGLPFPDGSKFIFSGGRLYKTISNNNLYYEIVKDILKKYPEIYFLYAGDVSDSEINSRLMELKSCFPQRVYCINERSDLSEIMRRCCFYLMTYPINGGLMFQQAIAERKIPIGLKTYEQSINELLLRKDCGVQFEFTEKEDLLKEIDRLLQDSAYRAVQEHKLKNLLILEDEFKHELLNIILKHKTKFDVYMENIDSKEFLDEYIKRLSYYEFYRSYGLNVGQCEVEI